MQPSVEKYKTVLTLLNSCAP